MDREGGYKERMRKFFLHFLILSPFPHSLSISSPIPLHFLIISSFPRSPAARLQRFVQPCTGVPVVLKTLWILMATPNNIVFRLWALSRDNQSSRCRLHKKVWLKRTFTSKRHAFISVFRTPWHFCCPLLWLEKQVPGRTSPPWLRIMTLTT